MSKKALILGSILTSVIAFETVAMAANTQVTPDEQKILNNAPGLSADALTAALKGYQYAKTHGDVGNTHVLTVVDFTLPSYDKRLFLINLDNDQLLMNTYVAQGKNSGLVTADHFSNDFNSEESSLGVFTTASTFDGKHGLSMHINGLEQGINNNANARAVEIHPAAYVTPQYIAAHHFAGRSWGCFAMDPQQVGQYIAYAKGSSVLFAYAKQENGDTNIAGYSPKIS